MEARKLYQLYQIQEKLNVIVSRKVNKEFSYIVKMSIIGGLSFIFQSVSGR